MKLTTHNARGARRGVKPTSNYVRILLTISLLFAASAAFAWDGAQTGYPGAIQVTQGGNYGFRVTLRTPDVMCGNANTWAYLEPTDSNYPAYVAVILSAQARGARVTFYSNRDSSGYCRIGHIVLVE
jgi:hypothetical protein